MDKQCISKLSSDLKDLGGILIECARFVSVHEVFMKKGLRPLALRQWTTRQQNGNDASNKSPPCGGGFPNRRETWD